MLRIGEKRFVRVEAMQQVDLETAKGDDGKERVVAAYILWERGGERTILRDEEANHLAAVLIAINQPRQQQSNIVTPILVPKDGGRRN